MCKCARGRVGGRGEKKVDEMGITAENYVGDLSRRKYEGNEKNKSFF